MSYRSRIRQLESRIKKIEDKIQQQCKPIIYTLFGDERKVTLPDGKEVTQTELKNLQMQGLYRECRIIRVTFIDKYEHLNAIQESTLIGEQQNPPSANPITNDAAEPNQISINNTNPPNEMTPAIPSQSSAIENWKRPSSTSPLAELFK